MVMRRRRTVLAVTGSSDGLGRALLERLAATGTSSGPVLVGIDPDGAPAGVQWRRPDVRDPLAHLRDVTTVVHLAMSYDPATDAGPRRALNVDGTAALLETARLAGVRRVVLVTGIDVYGAPEGTPLPLTEDAPLLGAPDDSLTGELVEVERLADHAGRTGLDVVVLRPTALVAGPLGAHWDGALLHPLAGRRLLAVRGVEPLWQLCHLDDLLSALELTAHGAVRGAAVVGCEGWLSQREVEQLSGRHRLELPAAVVVSTAERLHKARVTAAAPHEIDRLLRPLVLDADRLRAVGWEPRWTNRDALLAHLASRPAPRGPAASYTAAGATVALLGSAAVVRQARRRRGR